MSISVNTLTFHLLHCLFPPIDLISSPSATILHLVIRETDRGRTCIHARWLLHPRFLHGFWKSPWQNP